MNLESIKLKTFKAHEDFSMCFTPGINLIIGPNGAGKTCILEAIALALLGNTATEGLLNELAHNEAKDFSIDLMLSGGTLLSRSVNNSSLVVDGNVMARSHKAVNSLIAERLGLSPSALGMIVLTEQRQAQQLLDMDGMKLKRFIETVTGLDNLEGLLTCIQDDSRRAKTSAEALETIIYTEERLISLNMELDAARDSADNLQAEKEAFEKLRDALNATCAEFRQSTVEAEILEHAWRKYEHAVYAAREEIEACRELAYARFPDIDALEETLGCIQAHNTKLAEQKSQILKASELQKAALALTREEPICPTSLQLQRFQAEIEYGSTALHNLKQILISAKADIVNGVCSKCNRPLEGVSSDTLKEMEQQVAALPAEIAEAESRLKLLRIAYSDMQRDVENHKKWLRDALRIKEYAEEAQAILDKLEPIGRLPFSEKRVAEAKQDVLKARERATLIKAAKTRVHKAEEKLAGLVEPAIARPDLAALKEQCDKAFAEFGRVSQELNEKSYVFALAVSALRTLEGKLEAQVEQRKLYTDYCKSAARTSRLYKNIAANREGILAALWAQFYAIASDFVSQVTDGAIAEVMEVNGVIGYKQGNRTRTRRVASGSQKTIIGLGMKIALAKLVPNKVGFMLLDEISADMTPETSLRCLTALRSIVPQCVIVTHRELDIGDNIIELR